ncbi:MAG: nitroreductase family protein [Rikenellaceae bacterium]
MLDVIANHRTIRQYLTKEIPCDVLNELLLAATRASTVGTMQLYSIVVTTDAQIKEQLSPLHFNQPMVTQAPAVVTFCADVARFEQWCRLRDANADYQNMVWYLNSATDALLASQNFACEAENQGLGICYLGTTLYNAQEISEVLELPRGVIPVMALTVGYPDMEKYPPLTHRLPLEAVVHHQKYQPYSDQKIEELWHEIENSDQTKELLVQNNLPNLAQIFTERRYKSSDNHFFSQKYLDTLKAQGFL